MLHGVSWHTYVRLRDELDTPGLRMTYCEGTLELTRPSIEHEATKTCIARLIEIFALERDVPLYGYGSTTFRREAKATVLLHAGITAHLRRESSAAPDVADTSKRKRMEPQRHRGHRG
ncbi:hypothetical protein [Sorangium sp. So ce1024]|uniref:hypothetical protein n=1 Tax=unclassified Sorangium TaxID=2621164 RepID=UPI003F084EE5